MMTRNQTNERNHLEMLSIAQLVPENHLVRKLDAAIDFSFIYPLVENLYSACGRPSIDPFILFKITMIQLLYRSASLLKWMTICKGWDKTKIIIFLLG